MEVTEGTLIESLTVLYELAKKTGDESPSEFFDKEVTNRNWQNDARQGKLFVSMAVIRLSEMAAKGILITEVEIQEAINTVIALSLSEQGKEEEAFEKARNKEVDANLMHELMGMLMEVILIIQSEQIL